MDNNQLIFNLKSLIEEWEHEKEVLEDMVRDWNNHNSPESDPGLQYEQEMKIEGLWKEICDFCRENFKNIII